MKVLKNILVVLIFSIGFVAVNVYLDSQTPMHRFKNDILDDPVKAEKLRDIITDRGMATGDMSLDYDNYVMKRVTEKLSEYEDEKYKFYNNILSPAFMESLESRRQDKLDDMSFKAYETFDYIKVTTFIDGQTHKKFTDLMDLSQSEHLVIDLRDNSGGNFNDLTLILDDFVEEDKVLYKIQTRRNEQVTKSQSDKFYDYKQVYILCNEKTASVSELFVLSMKEHTGAVLIGRKTYGKRIQSTMTSFKDKSALMVISGIMLGPNDAIAIEGIEVDHQTETLDESLVLIKNLIDRN